MSAIKIIRVGLNDQQQMLIRCLDTLAKTRGIIFDEKQTKPASALTVYLVNVDNETAVTDWEKMSGDTSVTIFLGSAKPDTFEYFLDRSQVASRLISTIENIRTDHGSRVLTRSASGGNNLPRVLLVDDSLTAKAQFTIALDGRELDIVDVESGEQALEYVQREHFDIVFLDVLLPGIDGYTVCKSIKTKSLNRKLPVIFLTGKSSVMDKYRGMRAGNDHYLVKPASSMDLNIVLDHYLGINELAEPQSI